MEQRFLGLYKDGQAFLFTYFSGQETELVCALMDCANDNDIDLSWQEIMDIIEEVNTMMCQELEEKLKGPAESDVTNASTDE